MPRVLLVLAAVLAATAARPAHADGPAPEPARGSCVLPPPVAERAARLQAPPCRRPPATIARAITAAIRKDYLPEHGGKPEVKFPCDGLGPRIYEIVLERGGGHGGSLELWRARRRSDGRYDVRGIVYRGSSLTHRAAPVPHEQASGTVALPELATVRAALTATVREVVPPTKPGEALGMRSAFSSRDFHLVLRLVDDEGRVVERRYTGYATSAAQDRYLGLEIAEAALAPIWQLATDPRLAADADDRAFFAASFAAARPHFDDDHFWWVMERYVDLARFLGTPAVIRGLLTRLAVRDPSARSQVDARADAVDALAKITGWDARAGGKSIEQAAQAYLDACR